MTRIMTYHSAIFRIIKLHNKDGSRGKTYLLVGMDPVNLTVCPLLVETRLGWLGRRSRITSEAVTLQGEIGVPVIH
ncbi:hypothetical protein [Peribacillus butanolivorans]